MKLHELGEDNLVARLTQKLPLGPDVRLGAGDDCAVVGPRRAKRWQLLKTDAVVEGIHFLPGEKMERVGWKALCRAISDIAAMGGEPEHALVTLAVPADWEAEQLDALYRGLRKAAKQFNISIVGGETSRSPGPLFVSIALTGWVERERIVLRSGGEPGDSLYVTGTLGGSRKKKHLDFTPRLEEARWLTKHACLSAMMDISDGLGADLPRLAAASDCGFRVFEMLVPRTRGCSLAQALGDGEDFELLIAAPADEIHRLQFKWSATFPDVPLTYIGRLTGDPEQAVFDNLSTAGPTQTTFHGFDHFA